MIADLTGSHTSKAAIAAKLGVIRATLWAWQAGAGDDIAVEAAPEPRHVFAGDPEAVSPAMLLAIVKVELPASAARVAACKALLSFSAVRLKPYLWNRQADTQQFDADGSSWGDLLDPKER